MSRLWAVVPAAGAGTRMGAALPKQYLSIEGRTVLEHTLSRLLAYARVRRVVVALSRDDTLFAGLPVATEPRIQTCPGGAERCDSVLNALDALAPEARAGDLVLVHDAARPCVRLSDIAHLIDAAMDEPAGALLAMPAYDTVKQADSEGCVDVTLDRNRVWLAATPQLIRFGVLRDALIAARRSGVSVTDEAQAVERMGHKPRLVPCARDNIKITRPEDLALAAFLLRRQREENSHE
jgi:2-C-methyl-D-erythritol 4-phosphate cytidylyltransferase